MNKEFDFEKDFPPLGHPEHHFNKHPEHYWIDNKKSIEDWIKLRMVCSNSGLDIVVHEDLTVSFKNVSRVIMGIGGIPTEYNASADLLIVMPHQELPIQIRESERLYLKGMNFYSLVGTPYKLHSLSLNSCMNIKNLEGVSASCKEINLSYMDLESFKGMGDECNVIRFDSSSVDGWDGFTKTNGLQWWQNKWCEKSSERLLENTPRNIGLIYFKEAFMNEIPDSFLKNYGKYIKSSIFDVTMFYKDKDIKANKIKINSVIKESEYKRMRKI